MSVEWDNLDQVGRAEMTGYQAGQKAERERIIKLLETEMEHALGDDGKCLYVNHYREVCNCDLIALIKGENK